MSAGATEKLPDAGKVNANVIAWSHDDDQQFKKEELETVGEVNSFLSHRHEMLVFGAGARSHEIDKSL